MSYIDNYGYDETNFVKMLLLFSIAIIFITGMYGCMKEQTDQTVKLKAIEAGLHQDENGNWVK